MDVSFRLHPAHGVAVTDSELTGIVAKDLDVGDAAAVGDMTPQCRFAAAFDRLGARDVERFEMGKPLFLGVKAFPAVVAQPIDGFLRHSVPGHVGKCGQSTRRTQNSGVCVVEDPRPHRHARR